MGMETQDELLTVLNQMKSELENKSEESNQEKNLTSDPLPICPKCHGSGWELFKDEKGYEVARECDCGILERSRQESKLRFAAIPKAYESVRLAEFSTKYYSPENKKLANVIAQTVKYWFEHKDEMTEQGKGLYFWSDTKGCGKTMLATAMANELIHKYRESVKFATSLDILDEIRSTYNNKGFGSSDDSESRLLNDLATVKYLVIDDFGTERVTDWVGEKFYQIVNKRYINKKVTFFTSNYDLKTIDYDSRITSRIRERAYIVHFPEESVREIKAQQEEKSIQNGG